MSELKLPESPDRNQQLGFGLGLEALEEEEVGED